ncbi:MAG: IscS subfamily cysteine desulfurase [Butyrivibrio sp.]|jgi:cysteine desulfurase|nr:IscS subfamily cysteine desulfurase [Butyrivibrio sp.]
MSGLIYLDHAATTACDPKVVQAMLPWFSEAYGNPSTMYSIGAAAAKAVRHAREQIAQTLGACPEEIFFTSGGTESDNWALKGIAQSLAAKGHHLITTKIEHPAVLESCAFLEKNGYEITYLDVDSRGQISLSQLEEAIRPDTILISVMYANNEIGTVEPVRQIAETAHRHGVLFHTDAVQAYGQIPISAAEDGIDLLSASGHKFYGPKGIGFLYIRKGIAMERFMHGGSQERGRRAGTENVPGIVGIGMAAELAGASLEIRMQKERKLQKYLAENIMREIADVTVNGPEPGSGERLPGNLNLCFAGVRAETAMIMLDMQGVCASAGSACTSGSLTPSHVLTAIGCSAEDAQCSLRFSIGQENTQQEMDRVVQVIGNAAEKIRNR